MNTSTSPLPQRQIGSSSTQVPALGFGCMGLVGWYGTRNDDEARATLLAAVDAGVTHYDTAASYQLGENEKFVGSTLGPFRKSLFIASKCGLARGPDGSAQADNRPETIRSSCEASLKRLGTDYIDLFYLHRIDRTVPIEESTGALAELVRAGKIRHGGLSECSVATLQRGLQGAAHRRRAERVFDLVARSGTGNAGRLCRAGRHFRGLQSAGPGFPGGEFQLGHRPARWRSSPHSSALPARRSRRECRAGGNPAPDRFGPGCHAGAGGHCLGAGALTARGRDSRHEDARAICRTTCRAHGSRCRRNTWRESTRWPSGFRASGTRRR